MTTIGEMEECRAASSPRKTTISESMQHQAWTPEAETALYQPGKWGQEEL